MRHRHDVMHSYPTTSLRRCHAQQHTMRIHRSFVCIIDSSQILLPPEVSGGLFAGELGLNVKRRAIAKEFGTMPPCRRTPRRSESMSAELR